MSLGLIDDVTPQLAPVYEFAEMMANTGKPVLPWAYTTENVADIYQMALAVAGSEQALRERPIHGLLFHLPIAAGPNRRRPGKCDVGGRARYTCGLHRRRLRGHNCADYWGGNAGDFAGRCAVRAGGDAIEKTWRGRVHRRRARGDGFAHRPTALWRAGDEPVQRSFSGYLPLFGLAISWGLQAPRRQKCWTCKLRSRARSRLCSRV